MVGVVAGIDDNRFPDIVDQVKNKWRFRLFLMMKESSTMFHWIRNTWAFCWLSQFRRHNELPLILEPSRQMDSNPGINYKQP